MASQPDPIAPAVGTASARPGRSFFLLGDDCCPAYRNVRDLPRCEPYRNLVEALWASFQPSPDPHFLVDAKAHFLQRFWEMYLFVTLRERGMNPQKGKTVGPDFFIEVEGRRYWIEAIAPDAGDGEDRVPGPFYDPPGEVVVRDVPKREIMLRYTHALVSKMEKWPGWVEKGVVNPTDGYVIAIDGRGCNDFLDGVIPLFIEAFLPFGNLTLRLDRATGKEVGRYFEYSDTVHKKSQAPVSTAPLLDPAYGPVSAVLHSLVDCGNHPPRLGGDFTLLHNPIATCPIPDAAFSWCLQQHYREDHLDPIYPDGAEQGTDHREWS